MQWLLEKCSTVYTWGGERNSDLQYLLISVCKHPHHSQVQVTISWKLAPSILENSAVFPDDCYKMAPTFLHAAKGHM